MKFLIKNRILTKKIYFFVKKIGQYYSNITPNLDIYSVKNRNIGQKSKNWSNIQILVNNPKTSQKSKNWSKIKILEKIEI